MKTKQELLKEIEQIEEKEAEDKRQKELEINYQKFLNRAEDWVIGKAHCDIGITKIDHDWHKDRFHTIGDAISIHGNCGSSYNAKAKITSSTNTFFHNVWTDKQRQTFQDKLDKVALKEITKIMNTLEQKLEILGLQSASFFLATIYPEDKIEEIKKEVWAETIKILDKYKDKDFKAINHLSHSNGIYQRYLKEKRPHLYDGD
jgi:hypothetical protein